MVGVIQGKHGGAAITIAAFAWMQPAFLACQAFLSRCRRDGGMEGKRHGERDRRRLTASERGTGLPPASPRKSHREVVKEEVVGGGGAPFPLMPPATGLRLTCCGYACSSSSSSRRLAG